MLRWLVFPGTGATNGLLWASCWMIKKNICRRLIFFPLYSLFLFMSPVHASMLSCPKGVTPYAKWPFKFSIHISKAFLAFFFHRTCPLTLKKKSFGLSSAFFMTHLIFQCCILIMSISAPSGLSTVCLPISSVSSSEHICEKLYWWPRRESSLLIWLPFSFKWWNKAFQMKKNNFLWFTRKCWLCPCDKYVRYKVYKDWS